MIKQSLNRRYFLSLLASSATLSFMLQNCSAPKADKSSKSIETKQRPNILLITADDLNWDSVGAFGCQLPGITPNLDRLVSEGIRFTKAHVPISICQPVRAAILTARYPHNNGAMGFEPILKDIPTLGERLKAVGYFNGIMGKHEHYQPSEKFAWDVIIRRDQLQMGRNPQLYYQHSREFLEKMKAKAQNFFLHVNSHDPHRPFAYKEGKSKYYGVTYEYPVSKTFSPQQVPIPGFLPDLPEIREEMAVYYNSAYRCDETVGKVLQALEETGFKDNTIVIFLSDNAMAFPFAKANCYPNSTKTPLIIRWPEKIKAGTVDDQHLINCIDLAPTVLDAIGLEPFEGADGRSFLPLLLGQEYIPRKQIFTAFYKTKEKAYPMRGLITQKYAYIFNYWSNGSNIYIAEEGRSMPAMVRYGEENPKMAERVLFFLYRTPEEFYDIETDFNALNNLIDSPNDQEQITEARKQLEEEMEATKDPLLETFKKNILAEK